LNNLVVGALEEITEGLDATLRNEVTDLTRFLQSTRSSVRHCPTSFLLRLEVGVLKDVDQRRNDVGVDDGLDLLRRSSGDVRDGPASFLADTFFGRREEGEKSGESSGSENDLSLEVVTGNDVTDGSKSGSLNGGRVVPDRTEIWSIEN